MAFMVMMSEGGKSYWSWACSLTTVMGKVVSKQALFYRMTDGWIATLKALLMHVMEQQSLRQVKGDLFKWFNNVWLQDSTTLHLPESLSDHFKGNVSRGKQKAVVKLQVIINAAASKCAVMKWVNFTVNEQRLSADILPIARAGDLVIRDLGYFVLKVFKQLDRAGIFFLSRCKYGVHFYEYNSKKPLSLHHLLSGKEWIDTKVICGSQEQLTVRLVALRLPAEQAAERRRKARRDRDRRMNHSKQYYQLLDYVIFITNVGQQTWNHRQIADAYRVRWNIETLFKSWKSGFHIEKMIPDDRIHVQRTESILYLILLYLAWFQIMVYSPLLASTAQEQDKQLSIIKIVMLMRQKLLHWIYGHNDLNTQQELIYHCSYEKRKGRVNAKQFLQNFLSP
jgi:hypothetical protein